MNGTAIQVEQLSHRYNDSATPALNDISLTIPRGCSFGLLGPNGAGKTTLLAILTGLLPTQQGKVTIASESLATAASHIKRISALVPQDYAFYLQLTGRENLRFFADVYGLTRPQWLERLDYCTRVCRLDDMLDQRAEQYSGGMKRRLNLAIGLLNTPQILYLDEPTVGIDAQSRQVVIEAIQALRAQGTTVIYTSHYMEEVEALCDELAVINHGRLVARDRTAHLLQQGPHKTLLLSFATPPSTQALHALHQWQPVALHAGQYELSLSDASELERILHVCNMQQLPVQQAQFGVSKLERIYLSLLQDEATHEASA
jgi:ABC-2 type transport system ATP-binding protein